MDEDKFKKPTHYDDLIEALQNVKAAKCDDIETFVKWHHDVVDKALGAFLKHHVLYFNNEYYVEREGTNETLAEQLGIDLPKEGEDKDAETAE